MTEQGGTGQRRQGGLAERQHVVARLAARRSSADDLRMRGDADTRRPESALSDAASVVEPTAEPAAEPATEPPGEFVPFTPIRRRTAEHLVRSLDTAAHALVGTEVDFGGVEAARVHATSGADRMTYLPFVARAVIDALGGFPRLNGSVVEDGVQLHPRINLGIAVDLDFEGLVVPVVHGSQDYRLHALAERLAAAAERARSGRLTPSDVEGGTFTITNVGRYGTTVTVPIINQPQVAILSTDGVQMRPVAWADSSGGWQVTVRPVGHLSLSFDHRAVDGAYAAAFLSDVREVLEGRDWVTETS